MVSRLPRSQLGIETGSDPFLTDSGSLPSGVLRASRVDVGGQCYHILKRANARFRMFRTDGDFAAFERVLAEAFARAAGDVKLLAYCVMVNHWHLVIRTHRDRAMGAMVKWLTTTHAGRYRVAHGQEGIGPLYQGRYKAFLVQGDAHFPTVCRYVERNAGRAGLVERAEDWPWSSLWRWRNPAEAAARDAGDPDSPTPRPPAPPLTISPWPLPADTPAAASSGSVRSGA